MSGLVEASGRPGPDHQALPGEWSLPEPVRTSQHGLVPAGNGRTNPPDQAPAGGAVPAAKAIRALFEEDPAQAEAMLEVEDRILERALAGERTRTSATEVRKYMRRRRFWSGWPRSASRPLNSRGYSPSDVGDHRSDVTLPGRRLRRTDRLHGL